MNKGGSEMEMMNDSNAKSLRFVESLSVSAWQLALPSASIQKKEKWTRCELKIEFSGRTANFRHIEFSRSFGGNTRTPHQRKE